MDFWKYYSGNETDLLPNIANHSSEKEIAKYNPTWAYEYASEHGIDEELEPAIAKDAYYSYHYALDILEGPFELGEPAIAVNTDVVLSYASLVLKGPFELGEPTIAKDKFESKWYTDHILKKDFVLDGKLICKYEG